MLDKWQNPELWGTQIMPASNAVRPHRAGSTPARPNWGGRAARAVNPPRRSAVDREPFRKG